MTQIALMNMANSTHLYGQLFDFCVSRAHDLRHLKALAWMVSASICSGQRAPTRLGTVCKKESDQSTKCGAAMATVLDNQRVWSVYLPLVMTALSGWSHHRLYLPGHTVCGTGTA